MKGGKEDAYEWYGQLKKPSWAPPRWLFGPVWGVLYTIIAVSFSAVFYSSIIGDMSLLIALPFALNLLFNALFTPIQFGWRNNELASVDIVLIWVTLAWALYSIFPFAEWVAYVNIPYLLWVSFAAVLQFTITFLNR